MEPITVLSIISAGAFVYDRWKKSKGESLERFKLPSASGPNPEIGAAECESFTVQREGLRHFARPVSDGMFPTLGAARSAVAIPTGPITPVAPGARVFRVMPLEPGKPTAAEVVSQAHKSGQTVLASLSLIGLGWGSSDPMLIVVGGPELNQLARAMPRGDFALLDPKVERVVVLDPAAVDPVAEAASPPDLAAPAPEPAKSAKAGTEAKHKAHKANGANGAAANGVDPKAAPAAPSTEKSEG